MCEARRLCGVNQVTGTDALRIPVQGTIVNRPGAVLCLELLDPFADMWVLGHEATEVARLDIELWLFSVIFAGLLLGNHSINLMLQL